MTVIEMEAKQQTVDLKPFKGGATIFGAAAVQAAVLAGMDADAVNTSRSGRSLRQDCRRSA